MGLPKDVVDRVKLDFIETSQQEKVISFLHEIHSSPLNVGPDQFVRSILHLLKGDVNNLKNFQTISDPRDIIQIAEDDLGNPGHYFLKPFKF